MLRETNIKIMLFTILCICFIFYLFLGISSYKKDKKSKVNETFLILCISASLIAIGYAFMLISPNIEIANIWRIVADFGRCFFNAIWVSFAFSLKGINQKNSNSKIQFLIYITSIIFFINNLLYEPSKVVSSEVFGFVGNLYITTAIGHVFSIYIVILFITSNVIIYFIMKNSQKNRVRKQMKTILITSLISFCLIVILQLISKALGIVTFPYGSITISISMGGMWYAINKHKMMSISYELVSEYIFEAVNEPIFILGEDLLVKNCNQATLNITGYNYKDLKGNSLHEIIKFRDFKFNTIMQEGNVINIEVDLYRKNKEALIYELSATVIYDEYKDVLGILTLLHDVSERKSRVAYAKMIFRTFATRNGEKRKRSSMAFLDAREQLRLEIALGQLLAITNRVIDDDKSIHP